MQSLELFDGNLERVQLLIVDEVLEMLKAHSVNETIIDTVGFVMKRRIKERLKDANRST